MDFVSQFWGTTHHGREGKGWWKKHEAAGHFVPVVRKQREMTLEAYLFSFLLIFLCFIQLRSPASGIILPIVSKGLSSQLT